MSAGAAVMTSPGRNKRMHDTMDNSMDAVISSGENVDMWGHRNDNIDLITSQQQGLGKQRRRGSYGALGSGNGNGSGSACLQHHHKRVRMCGEDDSEHGLLHLHHPHGHHSGSAGADDSFRSEDIEDAHSPSLAIEGSSLKRSRYYSHSHEMGDKAAHEHGNGSDIDGSPQQHQQQHIIEHAVQGPAPEALVGYLQQSNQANHEKCICLQRELESQCRLNTLLLEKLTRKDDETKVLGRGLNIADGRLKDLQQGVQHINAENLHLRTENAQMRNVMAPATEYIAKLERTISELRQHIHDHHESSGSGTSGGGGGDDGHYFGGCGAPPPDVF